MFRHDIFPAVITALQADKDSFCSSGLQLDCTGLFSIQIEWLKCVSIVVPLMIIFNKVLTTSVYPEIWKRGNVVPVHKKESKNLVKNYRPISLLPIFWKIFEKIIYNVLFEQLKTNDLLVNCQSGFLPGDHAFRSSFLLYMISIKHLMETLL